MTCLTKLNKKELQQLKKMLINGNYTHSELAIKFNVSLTPITIFAKKNNIPIIAQLEKDIARGWKICSRCNEARELKYFNIDQRRGETKWRFCTSCKECRGEHIKSNKTIDHELLNAPIDREKIKNNNSFNRDDYTFDKPTQREIEDRDGWKICVKCKNKFILDEFKIYANNYRSNKCIKCKKITNKQNNDSERHKESARQWSRRDYQINKNKRLLQSKQWALKNKDKIYQLHKEYYIKNKEKINARNRKYLKEKRKNLNFRMKKNLRLRIRSALHHNKKGAKTMKLIGCSFTQFKKYIESLWLNNMNWDNYGNKPNQWSIDHILPCELFDLSDEKQQLICFNFKNMRPMWHSENVLKNDLLPNGKRARNLTKEEKIFYLKSLGYLL